MHPHGFGESAAFVVMVLADVEDDEFVGVETLSAELDGKGMGGNGTTVCEPPPLLGVLAVPIVAADAIGEARKNTAARAPPMATTFCFLNFHPSIKK